MKKIFTFRKGALLTLLVAAATVVNCSKNHNDEPEVPTKIETPEHLSDWTPQPKVDVAQPYMAFATGSTSATTLSLTAVGATVTATDVWVDTNNNGVFDEGTDVKVTDFSKPVTFKVTDKVFTVYGKVTELNATGNALTAADLRSNEALTKLNIADNNLSEKALLDLVKSLPAATSTAEVVLRKATDDGNTVTEAVLIAAKERGWQALKIEGDKQVPDLPADTEAPKAGTITEATATAFNTVFVKWTAAADNKTAAEKLRYQVLYNVQGSGEVKTSELTENTLELSLTGLAEKTTYVVKVKVMDEAGNATDYEAKEVTTPAAPVTADTEAPKAGAITEATATFNSLSLKWTAATDNKTAAEKLRYQVIYQVKGSGEVKTSELTANRLELTLKGLPEKTTYIVKVKVLDEANNAAEYEAKEVTTDAASEDADTEAPKAGTISSIKLKDSDKAVVEWTPATDNKTPQNELEYWLSWINLSTNEEGNSGSLTGVTKYEITITPNTQYAVFISVWDKKQNKTQYKQTSFYSHDTKAPEMGTPSVSSNETEATVSWREATDNITEKSKLSYQVCWIAESSGKENCSEPLVGILNYTIKNLTPNTQYKVRLKVKDEAGNESVKEGHFITEGLDTKHFIILAVKNQPKEQQLTLGTETDSDRKSVWVDVNNNGNYDKNTDLLLKDSNYLSFTPRHKVYKVYGRVKSLECHPTNDLEKLDVRNNELLTTVRVNGNALNENTFFPHNKLEIIELRNNDFTKIDFRNLPELKRLYLSGEKLNSVDLSHNTQLRIIQITNSKITSLKLDKNTALTNIVIGNNEMLRAISTNATYKELNNLEVVNCKNLNSVNFRFADMPNLKYLSLEGTQCRNSIDTVKANYYIEKIILKNTIISTASLKYFIGRLPNTQGTIILDDAKKTQEIIDLVGEQKWNLK